MIYPCLHVIVATPLAEKASDLLVAAGATGLETRDASTMIAAAAGQVEVIGWFESENEALAAKKKLEAVFGEADGTIRLELVEDPGWREAWRDYFKPMRFGGRLWVAPPDEDPPTEAIAGSSAKNVIVRLLPSVAFGTGTHESTALMLELVEALLRPGMRVLDVGCGSGILAIAALKLGAELALGTDIDPEAVLAARENALNNGVADRCRFEGTPLNEIAGHYDLVFANLSAPVLIQLKNNLVTRVSLDGYLLWSGLLESDLAEVGPPPCSGLHRDLRKNGWVAQAWQKLLEQE